MRIRIRGSAPLTNGSGSADPTPFFSNFKDVKKKFRIFSYNLSAGTLSSVYNLLLCFKDNFVLNFILQTLFQSAQHLYEKKEESGAPLTNRSRSGRPKNIWIRIPKLLCFCHPWSTNTHIHPASPPVRYSSIILKSLSFCTSLFWCGCVGVRGQQREERGGGGDGEGGHPRPRRPAGQ